MDGITFGLGGLIFLLGLMVGLLISLPYSKKMWREAEAMQENARQLQEAAHEHLNEAKTHLEEARELVQKYENQ